MGWDAGWDPPQEDQDRGISENPAVDNLVDDPATLPDYVVVRGWLGRSPVVNVWRVYLNIHLSEYLEVAAADIRWAIQRDEWTAVWINRDAAIRRITRRPVDPEVSFLGGAITDRARADRMFDHDAYRTDTDFDPDPTKCGRCPSYSC